MADITIKGMTADQLSKVMAARVEKRMEVALILLRNEMKTGLSEHSNRLGTHDSAASAGGYPFKITGRLAASVSYELDKSTLVGRAGSNLKYAKFLQLGTRYMAARPWLTLAYNACIGKIKQIINGK